MRCCFAHGTVLPRWQITEKYRVEYQIGGRRIDLRNVDGTTFDYAQVGGVDVLRGMRKQAEVLRLLASG
jgi:hypothetical protein